MKPIHAVAIPRSKSPRPSPDERSVRTNGRRPSRLAAALLVAVAAAGCTTIITNPGNAVPDSVFVRGAATSSQNEIQAGRVAQQKASDPAVKAYAAQMVQDHTMANAQLSSIVAPKGVNVNDAPDAEHVAIVAQLSAMSGPAFDRAYLQQMVVDHQKAVALFETEARTGGDLDLKSFAGQTLPLLQQHLQMAQQLAGR